MAEKKLDDFFTCVMREKDFIAAYKLFIEGFDVNCQHDEWNYYPVEAVTYTLSGIASDKDSENYNSGIQLLDALLAKGVRITCTAFTKCPDIDILKHLIPYCTNINSINPQYGWTALSYAVTYGSSIDLVKFYLENGADPNIQNVKQNGFTSLHLAIRENKKEIVKLLLNSGANQNIPYNDGTTMDLATYEVNDPDVIRWLKNGKTDDYVKPKSFFSRLSGKK